MQLYLLTYHVLHIININPRRIAELGLVADPDDRLALQRARDQRKKVINRPEPLISLWWNRNLVEEVLSVEADPNNLALLYSHDGIRRHFPVALTDFLVPEFVAR